MEGDDTILHPPVVQAFPPAPPGVLDTKPLCPAPPPTRGRGRADARHERHGAIPHGAGQVAERQTRPPPPGERPGRERQEFFLARAINADNSLPLRLNPSLPR